MKLEDMITLIHTVSEAKVTGFSYEEGGEKLTISKDAEGCCVEEIKTDTKETAHRQENEPVRTEQTVKKTVETTEEPTGNLVCSPLVGTFYSAPAEDAADYVEVGQKIEKGQVLAIVEAMKLMNEIESDYAGVVTEIFVKKGEAVEYGQPLFRIA